jgi:hypothetical protein
LGVAYRRKEILFLNRREVLRWLAATAAIGGLDGLSLDQLFALGRDAHVRSGDGTLRVLDPHGDAMVIAAAERIIPADETPGATDARVDRFIDHMLADWYPAVTRDRVLAGLRDLDQRSRTRNGRSFVDSTASNQIVLLTALDEEALGPGRTPGEHWFATFKFLTVWGYFTSEVAQRETLKAVPLPGRYDGCAPYQPPA